MNAIDARVNTSNIEAAYKVVARHLTKTPLTYSPQFSQLIGHDIYLKWDNKLDTGSFKERGAVNFLSSLSDAERKTGVCGVSAGNHALAVSYHAAQMEIPCTFYMPANAPLVKIESTIRNGAEVRLQGATFDESYDLALKHVEESGQIFIPPFDDHRIVCGQGTSALEVLEDLQDFDSAVVSIGGGGYISGISTVLKKHNSNIFVLGAQSEWAEKRRASKKELLPLSPGTIADGIAVKKQGGLTPPIIQQNVDKVVSVSEEEIATSVIHFLELERTVVEGACAAALAALKKNRLPDSCTKTVIFVGGSNIDMNVLSRLIDRHQQQQGKLVRLQMSVPDRPGSLALVTANLSASGANVLETFHDRFISQIPRNVDITFLLEVRNKDHISVVIDNLKELGVKALLLPRA